MDDGLRDREKGCGGTLTTMDAYMAEHGAEGSEGLVKDVVFGFVGGLMRWVGGRCAGGIGRGYGLGRVRVVY